MIYGNRVPFDGAFPSGDIVIPEYRTGRSIMKSITVDEAPGVRNYPAGAILHFDADADYENEAVGMGHDFNYSILSPQYQRNADGSYTDVGTGPAVDVFGGEKWLRSCGAITNLFAGDTSIARSVSLANGTVYTLHVFGAGTVSCSYGEATVAAPLKITATATASVEFTPADATYWMLTATAYPVPYVPPGVTQPASNATATNGVWFTLADGSPVWKALTGEPLTLATRVRMGVGSGDLAAGLYNILAPQGEIAIGSPMHFQDFTTGKNIVRANDGATSISLRNDTWPRNSIIRRVTQVNIAGTQFRVGYMIEGMHTEIQWPTSWVNFDGSFNPSTLYRLMLGFNNAYPMWFNKITAWKEQVSDARILEAWS